MEENHIDNELYKHICDYSLENITLSQLIGVAKKCVTDDINSEYLLILAGLSEKFDTWDTILKYYNLTLKELKIKEPSRIEAAKYLANYYCKKLLNKEIAPEIFLNKIMDEVYYKGVYNYDKIICGDEIGLENLIGLFYMIRHYNNHLDYGLNINFEKEKSKLYKECYKEAKNYLKLKCNRMYK